MANPEHLEILKSGVEEWNKWRKLNNEIFPVFHLANLSGADLSGADLSSIDLFQANLSGADLSDADLSDANLADTSLSNARLSGADLSNAGLACADLTDANLSRANLFQTNFGDTNLSRSTFFLANLTGANLIGADLTGANLTDADLIDADLTEALLFGANLTGANLTGADLTGADLTGAIFLNCKLQNGNFSDCIISKTAFGLTKLSSVRNLDKVKVRGECSIDFQTLRNSKNLPKDFLFKIGLPENYINYLPDFFEEKTLRLHPVFLSHSWKDKSFAGKLYEALTSKKVLVWYDERKLKPGDEIREGITKGIDHYDKFIIVCSENSLKESWWVDKELNRALKKEERLFKERGKQINTIIPITIDNYVFDGWDSAKKDDINRYIIGDFRNWKNETEFERKLEDLIHVLNVDREKDRPPSFL